MIKETILIRGLMGSHSVGTDTAASDYDYMHVVAASDEVYLGLDWYGNQGTKEERGDGIECVSYELKKFLRLCQNFNPNVIPLLWLDPRDYHILTPAGQEILDAREIFNSKLAVHAFMGYAYGQLRKMENSDCPTGQMGLKRKELRDKFGYDTKFYYHCIRLARMLIEFLQSNGKTLNVYRKDIDAAELLELRNGKHTYPEAIVNVEFHLEWAKKIADCSTLPEEPNKLEIRQLCKKILRKHLEL